MKKVENEEERKHQAELGRVLPELLQVLHRCAGYFEARVHDRPEATEQERNLLAAIEQAIASLEPTDD